jgi:EmrB/QacA subfamily drug resistance transporter
MTQLIFFRGLQGLGSGALFMSAFVTIADLYPPLERGKAMGVFGAAFGLASIVGPAIGGFFTDHGTVTLLGHVVAGWRWVFYVNLPLGLIALGVVVARMPTLHHGATGKIDFPGAALVILTFVPLLLALSFGGSKYAWQSAEIRELFALSAVAFVAFIAVELRTEHPIVPLSLFRNRVVSACASSGFLIGMIFFSVVMFMPLYLQVVLGVSATRSGLAMLPLMTGLIVGSIGSGRLVARIGRYKPFILGGIALLCVGLFLLTRIGPDTTVLGIDWRLGMIGLGLGPTQSLFNMAVQNAVSRQQTGVATSTMQFCRQIGSTVGVAVFGTLLTQHLTTELHARVPPVPGEQVIEKIDLGAAQSMAMNASLLSHRVEGAMDRRYADIESAYRGDTGAVSRLLSSPDLGQDVRADLERGGLQPAIREQLEMLATTVEQGLMNGEAGRNALLADGRLPPGLRSELAEVPTRALQNPEAMKGLVTGYRQAILGQESDLVAAAQAQRLAAIRASLTEQGEDLAARIDKGTREAFATSIVTTFVVGLFIVLGALLLATLIPELPLKARSSVSPAAAES